MQGPSPGLLGCLDGQRGDRQVPSTCGMGGRARLSEANIHTILDADPGAGEVITGAADAPGNVSAWGCLQSHRLQNCRQPLCSPAGHACQWPTLRSAFCVPPKYPPLPSLFKPQESVGSWARTAACLLHSVLTRRCPRTWRTSGSSSVGRPSFRTGLRPPACPPRYRSPGRKSQESFWPHAFLPVPFSFGFGSACFPVGSRRA